LDGAMTLVADCAENYRAAEDASKRLFNSVVFEPTRTANSQVQSFALRSRFDLSSPPTSRASRRRTRR
jgi:hypothetical protein